jgi:hypothetical protein
MSEYCQYWRERYDRQVEAQYAESQRIAAELILAGFPPSDDLYLVEES